MIYDLAKFECGKGRATVTATTYAKAVTASMLPCSFVDSIDKLTLDMTMAADVM